MMPTKKHLHIKLLLALCIFLLGIIVNKYVNNWPFITLKSEVDVFQSITTLLSLVITVSLAYWVTQKLEKSKESDRVEKDMFIEKFKELYLLIEETESIISPDEIDYQTVIAFFKRISRKANILFKHLKNSTIEIDGTLKNISEQKIKIVKDLLTLTPITPNLNPPLIISHNKINISSVRRQEVNIAFDDLKNHIFSIELFINKSDN